MTHPPARPRVPPRKRDPRGTRDRLVRAALDLFTQQGYHETTTPQIATRAGVAEGTIYRHFASKDLLLNELYRGGVRRFQRPIADLSGPTQQRLELLAADWCDLATRDGALVRIVLDDRFRHLLDDRSRAARAEFSGALETLFASGKSTGEIRAGAVAVWVDLWLAAVRVILLRLAEGRWKPDDAGVRLVIDGAWRAVAPAGDALQTPGTA